jgi:hypothetical protein
MECIQQIKRFFTSLIYMPVKQDDNANAFIFVDGMSYKSYQNANEFYC